MVGLVRVELTTSALSVLRSNQLSYSPKGTQLYTTSRGGESGLAFPDLGGDGL